MTSTFSLTTTTDQVQTPGATVPLRCALFRSIEAAGAEWDAAAPAHDIFLQRNYLSILEANPPLGMRFAYLVFYKDEQPVGVAHCQIKYFKGDDNIAELNVPRQDPCFFGGLAQWFKRWIAGKAAADILICGNMLLTGEHGYYFDESRVSVRESEEMLERSLNKAIEVLRLEGIKMPVILVKDIGPEHRQHGEYLIKKGFTEFDIQPNMVLDLPFRSFDEYLDAMSTKYRTRAKRAVKKLDGIERRELNYTEIQAELDNIYRLYRDIANNAGFNMVDLNKHYLAALKRDLGEHFRMYAYYLEGKLVAFYTTIENHEEMDAHFLGYDKSLNHEHQLYLNILYDIVGKGITTGKERIVFARTALEIKSSIGAEARDLWCYLRHQNHVANKFAPTILDYLKPVEEWQPRHPFKQD